MKKNQFWFVTHIPIAGPFIKILIDGVPDITNSIVLEESSRGEDGGWLNFVRGYLRNHPDEYPTKQLIEKISAEWVNQHKD